MYLSQFVTFFFVDGRDYTRGEPEDSYDYYSSEECDPQVFHCDEPEEPAYLKLKDHCKGELLSSQRTKVSLSPFGIN